VEYFSYPVSQIIKDTRCACEIKSRISIAKASVEDSFRQKIRLKFNERNIEVLFRSVALCGAKTRTVRKVDQKYHESYEMWCWGRMENITVK